MKIEKTWLGFLGEPIGNATLCDTIEHEGKKWLVPQWYDNRATGTSKPVRIICLELFQFQRVTKGSEAMFGGADYYLNQPFPRDVYEGRDQFELGGIKAMIEHPDIEILNPTLLQ